MTEALDKWFALHAKLIEEKRPTLEAGPCACGHDAPAHHGIGSRGCRAPDRLGDRCSCSHFRGTVVATKVGLEWLALEDEWKAIGRSHGLTNLDIETAINGRYQTTAELGASLFGVMKGMVDNV